MNKKLKKPIALALLLGIVITGLTALHQFDGVSPYLLCVRPTSYLFFDIGTRDQYRISFSYDKDGNPVDPSIVDATTGLHNYKAMGMPFYYLETEECGNGWYSIRFAPIAFVVNFIIWFIIILFVILVTLVTPIRKIKI